MNSLVSNEKNILEELNISFKDFLKILDKTNINELDDDSANNLTEKIKNINQSIDYITLQINSLNAELYASNVTPTYLAKEYYEREKNTDDTIKTFMPYMMFYNMFVQNKDS